MHKVITNIFQFPCIRWLDDYLFNSDNYKKQQSVFDYTRRKEEIDRFSKAMLSWPFVPTK